jgi:Lecithin retinol acyltransferase
MQTDFPLGAHLTAHRRTCVHHGIYVGNGRAIHNKWFFFGLLHCGVRETSLVEFSLGKSITQQTDRSVAYTPEEIVARARSRIGERRYHLITNNCEHFTLWCLTGVSRSLQIERWQARLQRVARLSSRSRSTLGHQACQQQV